MSRKSIVIIGEGITEKFYIESLRGLSAFDVFPRQLGLKASSLTQLKKSIDTAIKEGRDEVFCLIDMDGKREGKSRADYEQLKMKYHNKTHGKAKDGIQCKVFFLETERCIELWFLYHFTRSVITREFTSYKELEKELHKYRPNYEKSERYFKSIGNLHQELTEKREPKGSLRQAIKNSKDSMITQKINNRNYTYSDMSILFDALKIDTQ